MLKLDHTDMCSCQKPDGFFGLHGAHWHEHDAAYVEFCVQSKCRPWWGAKCSDEEITNRLINTTDAEKRQQLKNLLHTRAEERGRLNLYLGQAVFYEHCPAWVAVTREAQAAKKKEEAMQVYRTQAGVRPRG